MLLPHPPQDLPIFVSPVLELQVHTAIISFYVGTGDPNSGLMLVRQEIYHGIIPLSPNILNRLPNQPMSCNLWFGQC